MAPPPGTSEERRESECEFPPGKAEKSVLPPPPRPRNPLFAPHLSRKTIGKHSVQIWDPGKISTFAQSRQETFSENTQMLWMTCDKSSILCWGLSTDILLLWKPEELSEQLDLGRKIGDGAFMSCCVDKIKMGWIINFTLMSAVTCNRVLMHLRGNLNNTVTIIICHCPHYIHVNNTTWRTSQYGMSSH